MKVSEIIEGKLQDQARAEALETARNLHSEQETLTSYRNGHIHYAAALKHLCHIGLSVQQAKSRLDNP